MRQLIIFIITISFSVLAFGQTTLSGKITDTNGEPIIGANISIQNTYEGASSNFDGNYNFTTNLNGEQVLLVSFIGYKAKQQKVKLDKKMVEVNIELKESSKHLDAVIITAGAFDAGDEKKAVTLKPIDIATTASSQGDVYGALNTIPGTQKVGEEGRLFVRGGEGYEVKTYIDGMLVQSPYTASMPDVPARGRFSPFMFSGTVFSTGGYSAEYGQALSSVLILNTNALPEKSVSSVSLMSVGAGVSHTKRWKRTSVSINADYANMTPYVSLTKQNIDWKKAPENKGTSVMFRQKVGDKGMIKAYGTFSDAHSRLMYDNFEEGEKQLIDLKNKNTYINMVYNDMLNDKWMLKTGLSGSFDLEKIGIDDDNVKTRENVGQVKIGLVNSFSDDITFKFGGECLRTQYNQKYYQEIEQTTLETKFDRNHFASFAETEIRISSKFAARVGARTEYSTILEEFNVMPRISLANKLTKNSQVSLAYGTFYQNPENDYFKFNKQLQNERADHYIFNYQYTKNDRTFRTEFYYKEYDNLIKYKELNEPTPEFYTNQGNGSVKGIDVYWRDRKTFKDMDYWISYSYTDAERNYRDYKELAAPHYASKHNFSVVVKQWVQALRSQVGVTYSYSSGRPYYNPNKSDFHSDRAPSFNDLSFNISYLTTVFRQSAIVHFSLSNALGFDNTYTYKYNDKIGEDGNYTQHAIKPASKRFAILVFILSID